MTETQRWTIVKALLFAAQSYDGDALNHNLSERLRMQFARQASDARELAGLIENGQLYLDYENDCPECQRSYGRRYEGPCEHGGARE